MKWIKRLFGWERRSSRYLEDAFLLGAVFLRLFKIIEERKENHIDGSTLSAIKNLCKRLYIPELFKTIFSEGPRPKLLIEGSEAYHRIEAMLFKKYGLQARNTFMLGFHLGLSNLAATISMRDEAISHAEKFAVDIGISRSCIRNVVIKFKSMPFSPGKGGLEWVPLLEEMLREIKHLKKID